MATTTFSGPVKSQRGFVTAGPDSIVNITSETTLTFAAHAGKVIKVNIHNDQEAVDPGTVAVIIE